MAKKRWNREPSSPAPTMSPASEVPSAEVLPEVVAESLPAVAESLPDVVPEPVAKVLPHEAGTERCSLANHHDGHGHCIRCLHCKVKVRPQHMGQPCPARNGE